MKTFNNRRIAQLSIYVALMIILVFVPYTGFINIGIGYITIIPIVIALAAYHQGFLGAMITSTIFGVGSFVITITGITPAASILFTRPEIAIAPRIALGLVIYAIYKILGKLRIWKFILLSALTFILNTSLVTGFMFMTATYDTQVASVAKTLWLWLGLIWINFVAEVSVGIFVSIPLYVVAKGLIENNNEFIKNSW